MPVNRLLTFECSDRRYALRLDEVAALDQLGPLRVVPATSAEILGLASRRGRVVTVVDASQLLGADPVRDGVLVLLERPFDRTALYVPSPVRVTTLSDDRPDADGPARDGTLRVLEARSLVEAVRARNSGRTSRGLLEGDGIASAGTDSPWT